MWFQNNKASEETNRLLKLLSERTEKFQKQADSFSQQQTDSIANI